MLLAQEDAMNASLYSEGHPHSGAAVAPPTPTAVAHLLASCNPDVPIRERQTAAGKEMIMVMDDFAGPRAAALGSENAASVSAYRIPEAPPPVVDLERDTPASSVRGTELRSAPVTEVASSRSGASAGSVSGPRSSTALATTSAAPNAALTRGPSNPASRSGMAERLAAAAAAGRLTPAQVQAMRQRIAARRAEKEKGSGGSNSGAKE